MNLPTVPLKSAGVARILLWLLRFVVIIDGITTIFKLIAVISPAPLLILITWQNLLKTPLISVSLPCIYLAILLLSLVWIYRLHHDLYRCYQDYPIDAWDALWRFILPGYNIWGIWNTLKTIGRYFQAETGRLYHFGRFLNHLVTVMYGIFITSYLFKQLIYKYDYLGRIESIRNIPIFLLSVVLAGNQVLGLIGGVVLLLIAQTIVKSMQIKVNQINRHKSLIYLE